MLICYIDESGTPEIPGNSTHFVLAGLAIPVEKWKLCEDEVEALKRKYALSGAEIHAGWLIRPYPEQIKINGFEKLTHSARRREVEKLRIAELLRLQKIPNKAKQYHGTKKTFKQTADYIHLTFDERRQFVLEVAKLIGSWSFCHLFSECIDKIQFNPKWSVEAQAFEQVVSRFEHYLKSTSHREKSKQYGLLVHDNNQTVSKKHTEIMKNFHQKGTLWTTVEHIIETPMFVDSQLTSMIQLADVCCYALRRYAEKSEEYLFNEIFKIAHTKNGKAVGVRHYTGKIKCGCTICSTH